MVQSHETQSPGDEPIHDTDGQPDGAEVSDDPITRSERVAAALDALVDLAQRHTTAEYKPFGEIIGLTFALAVGRPLDPIYWYCERHGLPPLSVLVVNQATGLPGPGFGRITREKFTALCAEVFEFDWSTVPNPFAFAAVRVGGTDPVTRLLHTPDAAEDVYRSVKDRGRGQLLFRDLIFSAYGGRCAVSGSEIRAGLGSRAHRSLVRRDAAHAV